MAEFYIAYPGRDPLDFTIAVFEALHRRASPTKAYLEGRWTDEQSISNRAATDNRMILLQWKLPSYYADPFKDDEEE